MEYKIVKEIPGDQRAAMNASVSIEEQMPQYLVDGWEPLGGVAIDRNGRLYQAIIRRDDGIRYRKVSAPPGIADDMPVTFPDHPVIPPSEMIFECGDEGLNHPNHDVWQPEDE